MYHDGGGEIREETAMIFLPWPLATEKNEPEDHRYFLVSRVIKYMSEHLKYAAVRNAIEKNT